MSDTARDLFGQTVGLNDLVVYGHSGRYAGTRVGRVYKILSPTRVRVWIFHRDSPRAKNPGWIRGNHAEPNGFVRMPFTLDDVPPMLLESQLQRGKIFESSKTGTTR